MVFRAKRRRLYRTRLDLQTLSGSTSADSRGHSQQTFATIATVQASVEQLRGREGMLARELIPTATHRIELDYHPSVTPRARFRAAGSTSRFFNVESAENVEERNRTHVCICVEEIKGG